MSNDTVRLQVRLFGGVQAIVQTAAGGSLELDLPGQSRHLLALLTLACGVSRSRQDLSRDLWGEDDDDQAAQRSACLNTALWRLRRGLERASIPAAELVRCDRMGRVVLPREGQVACDVDPLRAALPLLSRPLAAISVDDKRLMLEAVSSYRSDLLTGIESPWALREREAMRRNQLNLLGRLMQLSALKGDANEAIEFGHMVLEIDPLREDIHRELIRVYMLTGQRAQALMQFETCRDVLRRELAIAPMPETLALYQRIADAAVGRDTAAVVRTEMPIPLALPAGADRDAGALLAEARAHLAAADSVLRRIQPRLA